MSKGVCPVFAVGTPSPQFWAAQGLRVRRWVWGKSSAGCLSQALQHLMGWCGCGSAPTPGAAAGCLDDGLLLLQPSHQKGQRRWLLLLLRTQAPLDPHLVTSG